MVGHKKWNHNLFAALPLLGLVVTGLMSGQAAAASENAKIDLLVRPPAYSGQFQCGKAQPLAEIVYQWTQWDGQSPIAKSKEGAMRIDAKRMASQDPKRFFDKVDLMFSRLVQSKNPSLAVQAGIDRARLYLDAGRLTKDNATEILKPVNSGLGARNGSSMLILGEIYEKGIAVEADTQRSVDFYLKAAQAGQADALLRLTELELNGTNTNSGLSPVTAMRLAFKGMMDNEVPDACAGIKRIGRIYAKGTGVIPQDHLLASQWYQLAADAGDLDSSWIVARYHLIGENLATDHKLLRTYLKQAAEGGIIQAAVEMGRSYEDGTLFPKDIEAARNWYAIAAKRGSMFARMRLAWGPLAKNETPDKTLTALKAVADLENAPPVALAGYADAIMRNEGRINGFAKAKPYFQRAADAGDFDARKTLLRHALVDPAQKAQVLGLVNRFENEAKKGDARAAQAMADYYTCQSPLAPETAKAQFYRDMISYGEANLGAALDKIVNRARSASGLVADDYPLLRSAATRGMPDALALVTLYAEANFGDDSAEVRFWKSRMEAEPAAIWRYAKVAAASGDAGQRTQALAWLEKAAAKGNFSAAVDLAEAKWKASPRPETLAGIADLLRAPVLGGFGPAMEFGTKTLPAKLFAELALPEMQLEIAASKGDARFIAAAVKSIAKDDDRRAMFKTAVETAKCSFTEQIALADMAIEMNDAVTALRLLKIIEALTGGTASDFYKTGLLYEKLSTPYGDENKVEAFSKAANLGHVDAARRLVDERLSNGGVALDFVMLKSQLPEIARVAAPSKLFGLAEQILTSKVDNATMSPVEQNQMAQYLYLNAAERGHVASMRELGLGINSGNFSATNGQNGYDWLEKAATANDKIALRTLSVAYYNGLGVSASREKSLIFLEKAAKLGDKASVRLLARLKEFETAKQ